MIIDRSLARLVPKGLGPALAILLALASGAGAAGIYQWTDSKGVVHFTDDPGKVPKKYHDTVLEVQPPDEESEPNGTPSPEGRPTSKPVPAPDADEYSPSEAVDAYGHNRDWWRQRVQEWRDKKAEAQAKLADAQERLGRERFLNQTAGNMKRIQDISAEVSMFEEQVREAEHMLAEELPDEARKAQAPPGWLRE
jgi:hypothetical protein